MKVIILLVGLALVSSCSQKKSVVAEQAADYCLDEARGVRSYLEIIAKGQTFGVHGELNSTAVNAWQRSFLFCANIRQMRDADLLKLKDDGFDAVGKLLLQVMDDPKAPAIRPLLERLAKLYDDANKQPLRR